MTVDDFLREIQTGPPCSGDHVIQHLNPHCPGPRLVAKLEAAERLASFTRMSGHSPGNENCEGCRLLAAWDEATR